MSNGKKPQTGINTNYRTQDAPNKSFKSPGDSRLAGEDKRYAPNRDQIKPLPMTDNGRNNP